jgi:hypothetical protein
MLEREDALNPALLEKGEALYNAEFNDALSVLGIQAETVEIDAERSARGRPVPEWSDAAAFDRVLSPQRASTGELANYAQRGVAFIQDLVDTLGNQLREAVCLNGEVREEILAFESDTKDAIRYMAGAMTGLVAAHLPAAMAAAVVAIATTLTVILLKKNLEEFCQDGKLEVET